MAPAALDALAAFMFGMEAFGQIVAQIEAMRHRRRERAHPVPEEPED